MFHLTRTNPKADGWSCSGGQKTLLLYAQQKLQNLISIFLTSKTEMPTSSALPQIQNLFIWLGETITTTLEACASPCWLTLQSHSLLHWAYLKPTKKWPIERLTS